MSLDDFTSETENWEKYKKYNLHEKDEKLEEIVDELMEKFPMDFTLHFIEASPAVKSKAAYAYRRVNNGEQIYYIRVRDSLVEEGGSDLKIIVLHELVHIMLYNKGYHEQNPNKRSFSDGDPIFHWLLGAVGAHVSGVSTQSKIWKEICEQFIDKGYGLKSTENNGKLIKRE